MKQSAYPHSILEATMYKKILMLLLSALLTQVLLAGCSAGPSADTDPSAALETMSGKTDDKENTVENSDDSKIEGVASAEEMAEPVDIDVEGLDPVKADTIENGVYTVTVDSSSSMFKITDCRLAVSDDSMSAVLTMSGQGYLYLYMGTGKEAVKADESSYIPYEETADGAYTFTVPVDALDEAIPCAAYSKRKEQWYDRTLIFRADSLPPEALTGSTFTDPSDLNLADGTYTAEVTLSGGSGKASVSSPALLTVTDGNVTAEIIWSSSNYDFMEIDGVRYDPVNEEGNSTFVIPVTGFDYKMPVSADTTAMSTPHLIDYTLIFDSASIEAAE